MVKPEGLAFSDIIQRRVVEFAQDNDWEILCQEQIVMSPGQLKLLYPNFQEKLSQIYSSAPAEFFQHLTSAPTLHYYLYGDQNIYEVIKALKGRGAPPSGLRGELAQLHQSQNAEIPLARWKNFVHCSVNAREATAICKDIVHRVNPNCCHFCAVGYLCQ